MTLPAVLRHRDFRRYLAGVVFSQLGTQGTFAVMLYHVYELTGSTVQVGLVGAAQGVAVLVLAPLGGHLADRLDRKILLQVSQVASGLITAVLAVVTLTGEVQAWQVLLASLLNSSAATFDRPVRKAVIPAMVPRDELVRALALMNPSMQTSRLLGPGVGGVLIAVGGPGLMYALDAATFAALILVVKTLSIPNNPPTDSALHFRSSVSEAIRFIRSRPLIPHLLRLDISAMLFAAYRAVLPAIAVDVLDVGPTGYGVLAATPPVGAILGGILVYRLSGRSLRAGRIIIATTIAYGLSAVLLAQADTFVVAMMAAAGLGVFDAIGTTLRNAAIMLETPDEMMGRVNALYTMSAAGGPALGELQIGWLSSLLGVTAALTIGGLVPILFATAVGLTARTVRDYRTTAYPPN